MIGWRGIKVLGTKYVTFESLSSHLSLFWSAILSDDIMSKEITTAKKSIPKESSVYYTLT